MTILMMVSKVMVRMVSRSLLMTMNDRLMMRMMRVMMVVAVSLVGTVRVVMRMLRMLVAMLS